MAGGLGMLQMLGSGLQELACILRTLSNGEFSSSIIEVDNTFSKIVIPANNRRVFFGLQNKSANTVYIAFGRDATASDFEIPAGETFNPQVAPTNQVSILGSVGVLQRCVATQGVT